MDAPTLDLLRWLDERERTYDETIDVWRTSCPRLSTWEDAIAAGLVEVVASPANGRVVALTAAAERALRAEQRL